MMNEEGWPMNEVARWMVALGSVASSVGLVFLGIGMSFVHPENRDITAGWMLMIGGAVVAVVGWFLFNATKGPDTSTD
jgi:predicted permease